MWINYGGSNRKLTRDSQLLRAHFGSSFKCYGSRASGHHSNKWAIIPDTTENRAWIKAQPGISINRTMNKN